MSNPSEYLASLFSLEGRTALITGGTRGIGASIAVALARAGANIILLTRSELSDATQSTYERIGADKCFMLPADLLVDSRDTLRSKITEYIKHCEDDRDDGYPPPPDILINCAGITRRGPSEAISGVDWDDVLQVNLTSAFTVSQILGEYWIEKNRIKRMEEEEGGGLDTRGKGYTYNKKIINVSSILSRLGSRNVVGYSASKGGLQQMTRALSNEWMKEGINVNCLAPGYTKTDINRELQQNSERSQYIIDRTPAGRWGEPSDMDGAVIYLASQASNFVSGDTITVDGGFTWYC